MSDMTVLRVLIDAIRATLDSMGRKMNEDFDRLEAEIESLALDSENESNDPTEREER